VGFLKKIVPTNILVFFDSIFQWTGAWWQYTPSVFMKAVGSKQEAPRSEKRDLSTLEFFKCPDCGGGPLKDRKTHLECSNCGKKWEVRGGIYDFREPINV
jgi:hypothetical protein